MSIKQQIPESVLKPSSAEVHPLHTVIMATKGDETGQLGILDCKAAIDESCCAVRCDGMSKLFTHLQRGEASDEQVENT